ncbi:MAG: HEAT repeat domain-containing protein, partial [Candidatus Omnitrophota bacterium]
GDVEVRRQALNCLSWFFPDKCTSGVLKLLHDVDNRVRKSAIRICGSLKLSQCISTLISLLSDSNIEIQKSAAASLKKITRQNFDFKATGSEKNKEAAIENWHFWWRDNQAKLGV